MRLPIRFINLRGADSILSAMGAALREMFPANFKRAVSICQINYGTIAA
jgi:hypothetical protein